MIEQYLEIINKAGGVMLFDEFRSAAQAQGVDIRLWLRAKHSGVLFTWLDAGQVYISTAPRK